jgi:uncharacterized protein (DUF3084 family)
MTDPELETMCETLAQDFRALPARVKRLRAEEQEVKDAVNRQRGVLAVERQEHDRMIDDSTAKHEAKCAAREKELAGREANLAEREAAAAAALKKAADREAWVSHRASDLAQRYRTAS